jgi:hypothetical protein
MNRSIFVLIFAFVALLLPVSLLYHFMTHATGGTFVYPIDDTYIHMVVARTLAFQGNWGIWGHEFESASSSILYTLILSLLTKVFGVHLFIPLIVNLLSGMLVLVVVQRWLQKQAIGVFGQCIIILAVIFLTPLPITVIAGMEHTLQCLFSFLFVFSFSDWLWKSEREGGRQQPGPAIYVYGLLLSAIRYEGFFLVGIACLLLLYQRRVKTALLLGIVSFMPLLIFGLYSMAKGSYFLPNSVLLKSDGLQLSAYGVVKFFGRILIKKLNYTGTLTAVAVKYLLFLLPMSWLVLRRQLSDKRNYGYILLMLTAAVLFQICMAAIGWFYRYEASLVFCSVVMLSVLVHRYRKQVRRGLRAHPLAAGTIAFLLILPLVLRSGEAFWIAPQASKNIYQQQYQVAHFLSRFYDTTVVGANDIGAISYFKDAKNLDLFGLANIDIARRRKKNSCTPEFLDSLSRAQDARIAVLYDAWFDDQLLRNWKKVATWTIPNNVICGDSTVSFYAIDTSMAPGLRRSLTDYQSSLPNGVNVRYF